MADAIFLNVSGIQSDSIDSNHLNQFDVSAYDFDLDALIDAATGSGAGNTFQPLTVNLFSLVKGSAALLTAAAEGTVIPSATLSVRKSGGTGDYLTITLTNVKVLGYDFESGHVGQLALGYTKIDLAFREQTPTGTLGPPQLFSFDLAAHGQTVAPLPSSGLTPTAAADTDNDMFLEVAGILSSSTDPRHLNEFDVTDYEFELDALIAGASTKVFQPFIIDLAGMVMLGLTDLMTAGATGATLPSVTFSVRKTGTANDYLTVTLSNVSVLGVDLATGNGARLALGYTKIDLHFRPTNPTGGLGAPETFSYDLAAHGVTVAPLPETGLKPTLAADTSNEYFLSIAGIASNSTDPRHLNTFDVKAFEFEIDALIRSGNATDKAFQPLVVDLESNITTGVAALLAAASNGTVIPSATFFVRKTSGTTDYLTITLTNVRVLDYDLNSTNPGRLTLDYEAIDIAYREQLSTGGFGPPQHFIYDLININGTAAGETLTGDRHTNVIDGKGGADTLIGLAGNDTYILASAADNITEVAGQGIADRARTSVTFTLASGDNIEFLETTNAALTTALNLTGNEIAQTITGNAGNNVLSGLAGNDTLIGNAGNDTLDGGVGNDILTGGVGDDIYIVNTGDNINESSGQGTADRARAAATFALASGDNIEFLETTNAALTTALNLTGNEVVQTITGNAGTNSLFGLAGNDTLVGNAGNDTLDGGVGNDILTGGIGNDIYIVNTGDNINEASGQGTADRARAAATFALASADNIEFLETTNAVLTTALSLTGNEIAQTVTGNAGANSLSGLAGNDILVGNAGNDTLLGGLGNDTLTGGAGNDFFVFNTALNASTNKDSIADYNVAQDTIRLENAIFTALGQSSGTLSAARFFVGAAAHDADDRIIYNASTGALIYDSNGNAAGGAIQFATLTNRAGGFTAADFIVI